MQAQDGEDVKDVQAGKQGKGEQGKDKQGKPKRNDAKNVLEAINPK